MTSRSILLVCPAFHGYGEALAASLRKRGHRVVLHAYDELPTTSSKFFSKVRYELPDRLGIHDAFEGRKRYVTRRAIQRLYTTRPDVVIVIRGDLLLPQFWEVAESTHSRTVLWLYDEIRRMKHDVQTFREVDRLITYSPNDAAMLAEQGIEAQVIPNAFDSSVPVTTTPLEAILFIGARYPNREKAMQNIADAGLPTLAVGRDWSHHPLDRLRTWGVHRPKVPARRDLARPEAYGLMGGAVANINIHSDQDGFTMRTFEVPGSGGFQLIDRPDVAEFYEPDKEVVIFNSEEEMVDLARRALADPAWARRIGEAAQRRTLAEHTFDQRAPLVEQAWD